MNPRESNMRGPNNPDTEGQEQGNLTTPGGKNDFSLEDFREARLFTTKDRATLTFYLGSEVASIHFDLNRHEIFYKGHNVKNMTLIQEQWLALKKFSEYMSREQVDPAMVSAYEEVLAQVFPAR